MRSLSQTVAKGFSLTIYKKQFFVHNTSHHLLAVYLYYGKELITIILKQFCSY